MRYIDLHCDTLMKAYISQTNFRHNTHHVDYAKLRAGDNMLQFFALFLDTSLTRSPYEDYKKMLTYYHQLTQDDKTFNQVLRASDISDDKINGLLSIEDAGMLGQNLGAIDEAYQAGVRCMSLTWNHENALAYPSERPEFQTRGLKPFGFEAIELMASYGIMIDVSHLSDEGTAQVCAHIKGPVIASHSNSRAVLHHHRNLPDDLIRAIGNSGGVIGLNFCPYFVTGTNQMTIDALSKHADHIKNVGGSDVVAIGSDFDGMYGDLQVADASQMQKLVGGLEAVGFTHNQIEKTFYRNALRVLKDVLK